MTEPDGKYFTRYRSRLVCIDKGIELCLQPFVGHPWEAVCEDATIKLDAFLKDYTALFLKTDSGFLIPLTRLACWFNAREGAICLSPYYSIDPLIYEEVRTWPTELRLS